jgi:hypothetical protein
MFDGTVFTLTISRSFAMPVEFRLCEREDHSKRFLLTSKMTSWKTRNWVHEEIPLTAWMYARLQSLYDSALDYDVKFEMAGLDGSAWCLETERAFTYSKACFWSPSLQTKQRRLSGLWALGEELWRVAKLKNSDLY